MNRFLRTRDGKIFDTEKDSVLFNEYNVIVDGKQYDVVDSSDKIEERFFNRIIGRKYNSRSIMYIRTWKKQTQEFKKHFDSVHGAIWSENGLVCKAKWTAEKGWELL